MMKAVVVAPGEGRFIAVGSAGAGVTVKASEAETGGLCTVWEGRIAPGTVGAGPPAGFERYLEEMKQLAARHGGREERAALAARFDVIPVPASTES